MGDAGTLTPSGLWNPIHVVASATLAEANGSLEHPFPDVADAVAAINTTLTGASPWDGQIIVHKGRYQVLTTVDLPPVADLLFQAGVTMAMAKDVSLHANRDVKALGTQAEPIIFTWLKDGEPWGCFTLFVATSQANQFTWATFEHASEVTYQGISVRGALSLEGAGGHISYCTFQNNAGDDGLSLGVSSATVDHCQFLNNSGDAIDVDGPGGEEISFCYFDGNGNDALDTGEGSDLWAHDNIMLNSFDTGVECGEAAHPLIEHNIMVGNAMGIGIKDDADPIVSNNTVYGNQFGITGYHFKAGFGTGKGTVTNTIVWGSTVADVALVKGATTKFSYSCIQTGKFTDSTDKGGGGKIAMLTGEGLTSMGAGCDDPQFVDAVNNDFHLKSIAGHWNPATMTWIKDAVTSPCIDKGDPVTPFAAETAPNGGRVDLGVYGGTVQASRSP
jgi:parallel beta-helix repeat protein